MSSPCNTKSPGAILRGASVRLGPVGPPFRAFKIAPGNFVDGVCRPEGFGAGTEPNNCFGRHEASSGFFTERRGSGPLPFA